MKNFKKIFLVLISILLLTGCGEEKTEEKPQEVKEEPKPAEVKPVEVKSDKRPYAIMINNINVARPVQAGLQDAYLMYEIIVEGGITRYLALFKDVNTAQIGTVRSARHYYLDYALENDAIYVHNGNSPQAKSDFKTLRIDRIEANDATTGWREKNGLAVEHTLYTSIAKLDAVAGKFRTKTNKSDLLKYSTDELDVSKLEGAKKADDVSIKYSNSTTSGYKYDATNKYYLRSVNNKPHTDYVTNKQYHFKNIITYQVKNNTIAGDKKGRQEIQNIGSGNGYFISNGYAVPIKWEKKSRDSQTKYTLLNGEELVVNKGNTFIQIQPMGMELKIS